MNAQFHPFRVGDLDCVVLLDGANHLGKEGILRRYPDATEADYRQAFAAVGRSLDEADSSFNILMISQGTERILVDSGEGAKPNGGLLPDALRAAGSSPDAITRVILTHTHRDHVLGLLTPDDQPVFPNARYVVSAPEMAFWRGRVAEGIVNDGAILTMIEAQGLRLVAMDEEILPGICAVPLPGHTPGQIGLRIESSGSVLFHLADSLHQPFQFAHPEWSPTFDADSSVSVPTRRAALARAADEGAVSLCYHMTFPGLGRVRRAGDAFAWDPLPPI